MAVGESETIPTAISVKQRDGRREPAAAGGRDRLAALDGMRFLAALMVVLFHYMGMGPGTFDWLWGDRYQDVFPQAHPFFAFGRLGVDFFFVISGFVIAQSGWNRTPRQFFISRASRLLPMYWVAVLLTTGVAFFIGRDGYYPDARTVIANLTMLQKPLGAMSVDGVYWTLWAELMFYVLFAIVVWRGVTYRRIVIFCGVWTLAAVLAVALDNPFVTLVVNPYSVPLFVAGMAFHLIHRFGQTPMLWGIVGMSWLLAANFLLMPNGRITAADHWHPRALWLLIFLVLVFAAIAVVALGYTSGIRWKWLTTAGALTFPLYLLHDEIGLNVIYHLRDRMNPYAVVAVLTAGMLVAVYLLERFVERPLAKRMRTVLTNAKWSMPRD